MQINIPFWKGLKKNTFAFQKEKKKKGKKGRPKISSSKIIIFDPMISLIPTPREQQKEIPRISGSRLVLKCKVS